ncbi:hypothetical protein F2P81_023615 [Scophthalmus maximus]|uniref:Uncharacterized protein n=1 Tax=Scophthalmus maximus TaxID=52904 RepID=A0A6A4RS32_SCOMX|nr:hypothetical protein F2P81_023615 [Scophthalmus maximus]
MMINAIADIEQKPGKSNQTHTWRRKSCRNPSQYVIYYYYMQYYSTQQNVQQPRVENANTPLLSSDSSWFDRQHQRQTDVQPNRT